MSSSDQQQQQQMRRPNEGQEREGGVGRKEELPLESSPYVKYSDLEEYKQQAYGTQGHLPVADTERQGGATDAPTLSGSGLTEGQVDFADFMNRHGAV